MIHLLLIVIYLAFIGLGLPDSLLGSAWPSMYVEFDVPISSAGIISMTIALGIIVMFLPLGNAVTILGMVLIGLGCAPVYPCIIHATPVHFGKQNSQALIGVQMASAYVGTCLMPFLFGVIAGSVTVSLLPLYLLLLLLMMIVMHERLLRKTSVK